MSHIVNPFRQLLNHISHELSRQNLRSLLHICAPYVPEYRREEIKCGLDLFECLIQWNIIGEEIDKMNNLLKFMRNMRPKRRDIIKTVKCYIREHYPPPWGFESSGESLHSYSPSLSDHPYTVSHPSVNYAGSAINSPLLPSSSDQYSWCCICFDCKCVPRPVPNCFLVITSILSFILAIFVCILWFAKVPSKWHSKLGADGQSPYVGGSIFGLLALATFVCFGCFIWRKVDEARQKRLQSLPHSYCSSVEFPHSSLTSGSVRSLPSTARRYKKSRRRSGSTSTVPIGSATTDASYAMPHPVPTRTSIPQAPSTQLSYPDGTNGNMMTEEEGTSGDYAPPSDFASAEDSDGPLTVLVPQSRSA